MSEIFGQQDDYTGEHILSEFKGIISLEEQLKYVLTLLYSLDDNGQSMFRRQILEYEKIWMDMHFIRGVRERDGLVKEFTVEYHGRDYGEDDPFIYKEELEKKLNQITLRLMATLGLIIKYTKQKVVEIGDET